MRRIDSQLSKWIGQPWPPEVTGTLGKGPKWCCGCKCTYQLIVSSFFRTFISTEIGYASVVAHDENGNAKWYYDLGVHGSGNRRVPGKALIDSDGNVYIPYIVVTNTGGGGGAPGETQVGCVKLDSAGAVIWDVNNITTSGICYVLHAAHEDLWGIPIGSCFDNTGDILIGTPRDSTDDTYAVTISKDDGSVITAWNFNGGFPGAVTDWTGTGPVRSIAMDGDDNIYFVDAKEYTTVFKVQNNGAYLAHRTGHISFSHSGDDPDGDFGTTGLSESLVQSIDCDRSLNNLYLMYATFSTSGLGLQASTAVIVEEWDCSDLSDKNDMTMAELPNCNIIDHVHSDFSRTVNGEFHGELFQGVMAFGVCLQGAPDDDGDGSGGVAAFPASHAVVFDAACFPSAGLLVDDEGVRTDDVASRHTLANCATLNPTTGDVYLLTMTFCGPADPPRYRVHRMSPGGTVCFVSEVWGDVIVNDPCDGSFSHANYGITARSYHIACTTSSSSTTTTSSSTTTTTTSTSSTTGSNACGGATCTYIWAGPPPLGFWVLSSDGCTSPCACDGAPETIADFEGQTTTVDCV